MQHHVVEVFSMKALKALASRGLYICSRAAFQFPCCTVVLCTALLYPQLFAGEVCHCLECAYVVFSCIYIYRGWIAVLHLELLAPPLSHFVVCKVRRWLVLYCCSWWTERNRLLPHRSCLIWGSECLIY